MISKLLSRTDHLAVVPAILLLILVSVVVVFQSRLLYSVGVRPEFERSGSVPVMSL